MANALYIVPILAFLILIHEFGHFITARRAGMRVEEFGIGLPPRIWGKQRGDTLWSINAIPMGGFVRVLGEDGKNSENESMQSKTAGQRALFITAGSIMNFLTAFVLIAILLGVHGRPDAAAYIADVMPDTPAAEVGWERGDQIISVAGATVANAAEVVSITDDYIGSEMPVVIMRDGQRIETTIIPRENPPAGQGRTGIRIANVFTATIKVVEAPEGSAAAMAGLQPDDRIVSIGGERIDNVIAYDNAILERTGQTVLFEIVRGSQAQTLEVLIPVAPNEDSDPLGSTLAQEIHYERVGFLSVLPEAGQQFLTTLQRMGEGLIMLITGQVSLGDIAGPIGMGQLTSEIITESATPTWVTLLNITILLSLNLAILNLLPLPALDGGRLIFVIVEILRRGKRVAPEKEGMVHFIGLVLLLGLMFAIAFVDIDRIVSGDTLLQ
ncbi:RIP metalloprotease RseP [soil metagenome]